MSGLSNQFSSASILARPEPITPMIYIRDRRIQAAGAAVCVWRTKSPNQIHGADQRRPQPPIGRKAVAGRACEVVPW